jgi:hypothetical protein
VGIRCFLIEPIFGNPLPEDIGSRHWPPNRAIVGWQRKDTGEKRERNRDFGVGAMWFAVWQPLNWDWDNKAEPHLIVRCPNGPEQTRDWDIDSRASNCALPGDKVHRCWIRHGVPPTITVDKAGLTCIAGAGSIALPNWHGFLRNGELVP